MQCNQLIRLMKDWYLHVQEETMAPARMMQFAEKHIKSCGACQQDQDLAEEIEKIRDFVLPESKIPKAERDDEFDATPDISPDEVEGDDLRDDMSDDMEDDMDEDIEDVDNEDEDFDDDLEED